MTTLQSTHSNVDVDIWSDGLIDLSKKYFRSRPYHFLPNKDRDREKVNEHAAKLVKKVCTGKSPWPLFIHGPAGGGKTCMGLLLSDIYGGEFAVLTAWLAKSIRVMKGEEQLAGSSYTMSELELWRPWQNAIVCVLDEIGCRSNVTDYHYETLKRLIDAREGKPAVYMSNLSLGEIERLYDDRIASRLGSGTVMELSSDGDRRRLQ